MKKFVFAVLILFACASVMFAADLETYKASYAKKMESIILEHGSTISKLNESYAKALNTLYERATSAGDLDRSEEVMAEIERFATEKTVTPDNTNNSSPDLKKMQLSCLQNIQSLESSKARKVVAMVAKYDSALAKLQMSLVKQKMLNDAKEVQTERKYVDASEDVVSAKAVLSSATKAQKTASAQSARPKNSFFQSKKLSGAGLRKPSGKQTTIVTLENVAIVEAEHYTKKKRRGDHDWQKVKKGRVMPEHLLAAPGANKVFDINKGKFEDDSPIVSYDVQFKEAGTYYIWVRGKGCAGGCSVALGLDGKLAELSYLAGFPYSFDWCGKYRTGPRTSVKIEAPGQHQINFWMIEDSFCFDKFLITADVDFHPSDLEEDDEQD